MGDSLTVTIAGGCIGDRRFQLAVFHQTILACHDMHGNVEEWVEDCVHDNYVGAPMNGSAWVSGDACYIRVVRGGSWIIGPSHSRSALRSGGVDWIGTFYNGFRVARTLTP